MYCRRCGKELREGQLFCTSCGTKVPDRKGETQKDVSDKKLVENEDLGELPKEENREPEKVQKTVDSMESSMQEMESKQAGRRFCRYCGSEIKENAQFCTKCGQSVKTKRTSDRGIAPEEGVKTEDRTSIEQESIDIPSSEPDKKAKKMRKLPVVVGGLVILIILGLIALLFILKNRVSDNGENRITEEKSTTEQTTEQTTQQETATTEATEENTTEAAITEEQIVESNGYYLSDTWCDGYKMYIPDGFVFDKEEDDLTGFVDDNEGTYLVWGARKADSTSEEGFWYCSNGKTYFEENVTENVSYSRVEDDYCCYSYVDEGGGINYNAYHFDKKMMYGFELRYDEAYKKDYDSVVEELSAYITGNKGRQKKIKSVETTSVLESQEGKEYSGSNLIDGKVETAWVEGVEGVGKGESITLHLKNAAEIHVIDLLNGYFASEDLYDKNGKVSKVKIDLGSGEAAEYDVLIYSVGDIEYESAMKAYSNSIILKKPVTTDTITITILDAEAGDKYEDTCISEIEVY